MSKTSPDLQMKALQDALAQIERKHGKEAVMDMSGPIRKHTAISTQILPLDAALGIGGVPEGRIVEVFGPESSGKTTLCYHMIAQVQREGGVAAFIDTEHAMDAAYASALGVNMEKLIVSQPDFGEQALDIADMLVKSGVVKLIVIDSVAALTPKAEIEGQIGDQSVGLLARMMSQACRMLAGNANKTGTTLVFTNQIREKVGVMFGSPETQPGGRALKFYASQRLDIRRIETIKDGDVATGNKVRVKVVKNKVAPPFKQAEFVIAFGVGFDRAQTLVEMHLDKKVIANNPGVTKSGSFYTFTANGEKVQGMAKAKKYLLDNPEIADQLEAQARAVLLPSDEQVADDAVAEVAVPEVEDEAEVALA